MTKIELWLSSVLQKLGYVAAGKAGHEIVDNALTIERRLPNPAPRQDIHSKLLHIKPAKDRPHTILVEEVWVGVDAEGDPWSDHMGGRYIDLADKKSNEAAQFAAEKINEYFGEIFNG